MQDLDLLILAQVQMHKSVGITIADLVQITGETERSVRKIVERLKHKEQIKRGLRTSRAVWWIPFDAPALVRPVEPKKPKPTTTHLHRKPTGLTTPTNGPGYTPNKWAQGALSNTDAIKPPKEKPIRNGTTSGNWIAPKWELARPGAEDHKACGSRRGDEVQEWTPPISMCVGRGVERYMPDRLQR